MTALFVTATGQSRRPGFRPRRQRIAERGRHRPKVGRLRFYLTKEEEEEVASSCRQDAALRHLPLPHQQAGTSDDTQDLPPTAGQEHVQVSSLPVLRLCAAPAASTHPHPRR